MCKYKKIGYALLTISINEDHLFTWLRYVDTIDASAKAREKKFTWILLNKYKEGRNYIVRLRSKLKGDVDPVTLQESNLLPWDYSGPVTIIKKGTDPKTLPKAPKATKSPKGTDTSNEIADEPKGKGTDETPVSFLSQFH